MCLNYDRYMHIRLTAMPVIGVDAVRKFPENIFMFRTFVKKGLFWLFRPVVFAPLVLYIEVSLYQTQIIILN